MNYAGNALVELDGVHTNLGSHYDNATTFTCPINGTYFFTVSVMSDLSDTVRVAIELDSVSLATAWADNVGSHYPVATNSALVRCNEGQKVSVRCTVSGDVYGSRAEQFSTFSGFLVAEI